MKGKSPAVVLTSAGEAKSLKILKKYKGLAILCTLLIALIAVYAVVSSVTKRAKRENDETGSEAGTELYPVSRIEPGALTGISYTFNGNSYDFVLNDDCTMWLWTANKVLKLDNKYFALMASAFESLDSSIRLELSAGESAEKYGLDRPTVSVRFTEGSVTTEFKIGSLNAFNGMYYISVDSNPDTIYMVDSSIPKCFELTPDDMLLHDTLPQISEGKADTVTVTTADSTYVYSYRAPSSDGGSWYVSINGGDEFLPEKEISGRITEMLLNMEFVDFITYDVSKYADYGLAPGTAQTVTIKYRESISSSDQATGQKIETALEKTIVLELGGRAESGLIYAKLADSPYVYTLSPAIFGSLSDTGSAGQSASGSESKD